MDLGGEVVAPEALSMWNAELFLFLVNVTVTMKGRSLEGKQSELCPLRVPSQRPQKPQLPCLVQTLIPGFKI